MFGLGIRKRIGQLEDAVQTLRSAVARLEATEVQREASTASATLTLRKLNDRLRKQLSRQESIEDEDDGVDEVSDMVLRQRGYARS